MVSLSNPQKGCPEETHTHTNGKRDKHWVSFDAIEKGPVGTRRFQEIAWEVEDFEIPRQG